jgi:1,4-dihydroxy-2-naphthoate octaprenyltransferase
MSRWWGHPWVRHLRLPFNLLLSPIYLWGVWLAGGGDDPVRLGVAFLALHVFLYGGTNALNSYYDRDEGPVGGMWSPPPVDRGLLAWAWGVQLLGLPLAGWVGVPFLVVWLALLAVATAYSHPRWRWKAHPLGAVLTVALGQGGLGALAGVMAVAGRDPLRLSAGFFEPLMWLGLAAAVSLIVGLYVVSQAYQTAEDRVRGDRTLPVLLGPGRAIRLASTFSAVGAGLLASVLALRVGWLLVVPMLVGLALLGSVQLRQAAVYDERDVAGNFRRAMTTLALGGGGLALYLLTLLLWAAFDRA